MKMRKLPAIAVLVFVVLFNGSALPEQSRVGKNLRQEQVLLPATTPDRNRMAAVDSYVFFEHGGGVFIYYDDPRTKREVDYIEFYDVEGQLLVVTWIDRFGVCHVAMDRGLLNAEDPAVDGTLVLLSIGQGV
jgi:hypothetical protein